jgi:hypothetical protein
MLASSLVPQKPRIYGLSPPEGGDAGLDAVTIYGRYFTGVTEVRFGADLGGNLTVISDTELEVLTPFGPTPGVVDVSVTNAVGTTTKVGAF